MGMRSGLYGSSSIASSAAPVRSAGSANAGYASGGTSSYPVTGFPASAYLGNNRRIAGGYQASPSAVSSSLGNITQLSNSSLIITAIIIALVGYGLWHADNAR